MTDRQRMFAEYYLEYGNSAVAARMAGYSESYAQHVKKQKAVKAYLEKRISEMDNSRVAAADEILEFLTDVMRGRDTDRQGKPIRLKAADMIVKRLYSSINK